MVEDDHVQVGRERCYICGAYCPHLLEQAHIVPNRMGGKDNPTNLVELCPTCHTAVDSIFDYDFFDRLFKIWQERHKE